MRVVFFGTPDFAVPTLEALLAAGVTVAAVVTQPDRPRTRSHSTLLPSPVKQCAVAAGIPVLQPERPRGAAFLSEIAALEVDLGVVVAYGHILRPDLLAIPRLGMVNVHASLLPRWRGAAPIHWAILAGDRETGVSVMRMEAGLDSGPVWHAVRTRIDDDTTTGELFVRLGGLGGEALVSALPMITSGVEPTEQDGALVTLAPKVDRDTARIIWQQQAGAVSCRIRAMDPAPGAWTTFDGQPYKLFGPTVPGDPASAAPGTIVATTGRLAIACGDGVVEVTEVQPAGKKRLAVAQWLHGIADPRGGRFE